MKADKAIRMKALFCAFLLFQVAVLAAQTISPQILHPDLLPNLEKSKYPFYHGVASGDPLPEAVILWTRVSPEVFKPEAGSLCAQIPDLNETIEVIWQIALDSTFTQITSQGTYTTHPEVDYTVKIDAQGLQASTSYYYRFIALGHFSEIGKTRTSHQEDNMLRFAVVSCNNFQDGYFNAFRQLAYMDSIDAVLHLGDYIYEYGARQYCNKKVDRVHVPAHELRTLADYRTRFSQYRLDKDLQLAHQAHPFICIWDDHEVANNAYADGAKNHSDQREGAFCERKSVAQQAYYEWLPVRNDLHLYRSFQYGSLAQITMLDERMEGREAPAKNKAALTNTPNRSMLGETQLQWWKNKTQSTRAIWKIIGNQVLFSELNSSPLLRSVLTNFDAWDGYPQERKNILDFLKANEIKNTIIVTGDTHGSWSFKIPVPGKKISKNQEIIAHEFATPSITSSNSDEYVHPKIVKGLEKVIKHKIINPYLQHMDARNHGFYTLTLTTSQATAQWYYVDTVLCRSDRMQKGPKTMIQAEPQNIIRDERISPAQPTILAKLNSNK
jgi:alkaline phosphatase D